jgi:hypothetical protein
MSDILAKGPDQEGKVTISLPPWIFIYIWPENQNEPVCIATIRTNKERFYQKEDLVPPAWIQHRALQLAKIRFVAFASKKSKHIDGYQMRLPF